MPMLFLTSMKLDELKHLPLFSEKDSEWVYKPYVEMAELCLREEHSLPHLVLVYCKGVLTDAQGPRLVYAEKIYPALSVQEQPVMTKSLDDIINYRTRAQM